MKEDLTFILTRKVHKKLGVFLISKLLDLKSDRVAIDNLIQAGTHGQFRIKTVVKRV